MKIEALNGLKSNSSSSYLFGKSHNVHDNAHAENPLKKSALSKVPVIVLLAMNPATLNSAISMIQETDNPNHIVMFAPEPKSAEKSTYVTSPAIEQAEQSEYPFGWASLEYFGIKKVIPGKTPFYKYNLLFTTTKNAGTDFKNDVTDIFLVKEDGRIAKSEYTNPPKIEQVTLHDMPDGRQYYTVRIYESIIDEQGGNNGAMRYEIRLDNNSAKELMKLLNNQTEWNNATFLPVKITNTSTIMKPIKY